MSLSKQLNENSSLLNEDTQDYLSELPSEILAKILGYLPFSSNTFQTSKLLNEIGKYLIRVEEAYIKNNPYTPSISLKILQKIYSEAITENNINLIQDLITKGYPMNHSVMRFIEKKYYNKYIAKQDLKSIRNYILNGSAVTDLVIDFINSHPRSKSIDQAITAAYRGDIKKLNEILTAPDSFSNEILNKLRNFQGKCNHNRPFTVVAIQLQLLELLNKTELTLEDLEKLESLISEKGAIVELDSYKNVSQDIKNALDVYINLNTQLCQNLNQNEDLVRDLLRQGANPNSKMPNGEPCLHFAINHGLNKIVHILLKHGANPNVEDIFGLNTFPLYLAVQNNNLEAFKLLLNHGACTSSCIGGIEIFNEISSNTMREYMRYFVKEINISNLSPELLNTYLISLIKNDDVKTFEILMENGIDLNYQNLSGDTILHHAAENGKEAIVRKLLEDPNIIADLKNKKGQTPYDVAKNDKIRNLLPGLITTERKIIKKAAENIVDFTNSTFNSALISVRSYLYSMLSFPIPNNVASNSLPTSNVNIIENTESNNRLDYEEKSKNEKCKEK
ncbi:MAG: ankyrin repeat domain-containing protein [Sphingobacteriia bacterium]|nr:ankyrin repeat domain-containing protein [Sphingobacteriia bacterium]